MTDDFSEAKRAFDEDGYAVIKEFLNAEETADVQRNVVRYIHEIVPHLAREDVFYEDKTNLETLKQMPRMEQHDPYFRRLLFGSKFERLSEVLLDGSVVPRNVQYLRKPARVGLFGLLHSKNVLLQLDLGGHEFLGGLVLGGELLGVRDGLRNVRGGQPPVF